ncbi:MAG TPA: flagellar biosynthesis anti-sigma factor FlgM [Chromatiales bacterium]|nr:flagellar biosynthesis anti-sigma factor FlgM [Chromatiales bacterium]
MSSDTPRSQPARNRKSESAPGSNGEPAPADDNVTFTRTAAILKDIERRLIEESSVDPERVSRMKHELASGNYRIDTRRVADKMIEFEKLLKR